MRLKEGFVLTKVGNDHIAVATGDLSLHFNGMIRNNVTGVFLFDKLQQDTTEEELVNAFIKAYDGDEARIRKDVHTFIIKLREANLLIGE